MCKPITDNSGNEGFVSKATLKDPDIRRQNGRLLLLTTESFSSETSSSGTDEQRNNQKKPFIDNNHTDYWKLAAPSKASVFVTIAFIVACLFAIEHSLRYVIKVRGPSYIVFRITFFFL